MWTPFYDIIGEVQISDVAVQIKAIFGSIEIQGREAKLGLTLTAHIFRNFQLITDFFTNILSPLL